MIPRNAIFAGHGYPAASTRRDPAGDELIRLNQSARGLVARTSALMTGVGMIALVLAITIGDVNGASVYVSIAVLTVCASPVVWLRTSLPIVFSAWCVIGSWVVALVVIAYLRGGIGAPLTTALPILPVIAASLIGPHAAWLVFTIILISLTGFAGLEASGHQFPQVIPADPSISVLRALWLAITAFVATYLTAYHASHSQAVAVRLERQAATDTLTGVASRRASEATLKHEVAQARRNNTWLGVLMIDADHFKRVNDLSGHIAGDVCLARIADAIACGVRQPDDMVGRWGGEEFVVVLPHTPPEDTASIAERIRRTVEDLNIPYGVGDATPVTVTIGGACQRGGQIPAMNQLLHMADAALYRGKIGGRNTVRMAQPLRLVHGSVIGPESG